MAVNFARAGRSSQIETANQADTATASPRQAAATIGQAWLTGRHFLLYSDNSGMLADMLLGILGAPAKCP